MKACVFQPPYSRDTSFSDEYFQYKLNLLDQCDDSLDIIVLPEYSDVPCATETLEQTMFYHDRYIDPLLSKCVETAKRCHAIVFVNVLSQEPTGYRNTTYAYDRDGNLVGKYFKKHLPPLEEKLQVDGGYTWEPSDPYVLELEGLRFGFLTCYDFYFYESFPRIARSNVDIIIGCSLQRSDSHDSLETTCKFLAYNTNAYVLRSSVSFAEDSEICGASMIVTPTGKVLQNMKGKFGKAEAEFDPHDKHFKPAGFGNPPAAHHEYVEYGRKPWQYRTGGPAIVPFDDRMKYPRICAHRGFSALIPENSMPAFGAAIALGAEEIEYDIWATSDGELVACHDATLDRVSDGTGLIWEHTYEELMQMDFGAKHSERLKGLRIAKFEEILQKFTGQTIMNIHVKIWDLEQENDYMEEIVSLIRKYDCQRHMYFMTASDKMLKKIRAYAPDICCCVGWDGVPDAMRIVDRAIEMNVQKVQFFLPHVSREAIEKAHAHGIICNMFYADTLEDARNYLDMGIDTVLTNDYLNISQLLK